MGQYAGDVAVTLAWEILSREPGATLVDVRTMAEWQGVGTPNLSSIAKRPVLLSWRNSPDYTLNENFAAALKSLPLDTNEKIFFMCKGGGRSAEAAMAASSAGFKNSYNVAHGFEDDGGWKSSGLPWELLAR